MHGRSCVQMAHGVSQGTAVLITPAPTTAATATTTSYSIVIPSSTTIPVVTTRPIATSLVAGSTSLSSLLRNNSSPESAAVRDFTNPIDIPSFGTSNRRPFYHMRRASETMEGNDARFGGVSTLGRGYTIESPLASALSSVGTESPAQQNPPASNHAVSDDSSAREEATDAPPAAVGRASMSPQPEEPAPSSVDSHSPGSANDNETSRARVPERRGNQQQRRHFLQNLARPPPTRHAARVATRRISEAIASHGMAHFAESESDAGCSRNNGRKRHATRSSTSSAAASRAANAGAAEGADAATPPRRRPRISRAKADNNTDRKPASSGRKRAASTSPKSGPVAKKAASTSPPASSASQPSQENKKSEHSCCICLDVPDLVELSSINGCAHFFCFGCIEKWADRENTCPLCKNRFTKIDRVHKQTAKRKRKGETTGGPRTKNTKKVKNRDQRADLNQGNPLQGLFASIDGNGQVNQSIAQLIFSGLNVGGISGSLMLATSNSTSGNPTTSARPSQRTQGQARGWSTTSSASSRRATNAPSVELDLSSSTDPFPVHPVPVSMGLMRRLTSGNRPDGGPGVDATGAGRPFGSSAPRNDSSWAFSSSRGHNGPTPSVQVRFGPSSRSWGQQYSAASTAAALVNEHNDVEANDSDDDFETYPNYVQRVRNLDRERQAMLERYQYSTTGGSTGASTAPSQPPPASRTAPVGTVGSGRGRVLNPLGGETAATALLIDDSDDDDDIVEVVSPFSGPY